MTPPVVVNITKRIFGLTVKKEAACLVEEGFTASGTFPLDHLLKQEIIIKADTNPPGITERRLSTGIPLLKQTGQI